MPCTCWYTPSDESLRRIKFLAQWMVDEIKLLEKDGDPLGVSIKHAQDLLDHLYTGECPEKPFE